MCTSLGIEHQQCAHPSGNEVPVTILGHGETVLSAHYPGGLRHRGRRLRRALRRRHLAEWFGHAVSLDGYRWPPDRVAEMLSDAGLVVRARLLREPDGPVETTQRAYLLPRGP